MVWNYINFAAMAVGYVTIAIVLLVILAFVVLSLKERYSDWKWKKRREMEKQPAPVESKPLSTEAAKEAAQDKPNVEISIK